MKKMLAFLMLACVAFVPMVASAEDSSALSLMVTAETWNQMDNSQKLWYTKGALDGFGMGYVTGWNLGSDKNMILDNTTFSHTLEFYKAELDDYYSMHPTSIESPGALLECWADKPLHPEIFCKNKEK
jgi:hypothetical protein